MANFKAAGCNRFLQFILRLLVNQRVKFALCDAIEKAAHLTLSSSNLKFHTPIWQIADPAGYIKAFGGVTHGPAKSDALNISLIENLERNHDPAVMSSGVACQAIVLSEGLETSRCEAASVTITGAFDSASLGP